MRYACRFMQMTYTETAPPPDLAVWVASFWSFSVDPAAGEIVHTIPLTGGVMLSLSAGPAAERSDAGLFLVGPRTLPLTTVVRGGDLYRGVHLLPGASSSLFGVSSDQWRDVQVPARFVIDPGWCLRFGGDYRSDADFNRTATDAIRALAAQASALDPAITGAVVRLLLSHGNESIADLARDAALSPRQFRRRFCHHVGLTPKELARIIRLRAAASAAATRDESWVDIVAEHGFADQPHLVREFRSMLGDTPTRFVAHARRIAHHLKEL